MKRLLCVAAAAWLAAATARAEAPKSKATPAKVAEVVRRLQARYDSTKDFTADFTQTVEAATVGKPLESSGQVSFKRP